MKKSDSINRDGEGSATMDTTKKIEYEAREDVFGDEENAQVAFAPPASTKSEQNS